MKTYIITTILSSLIFISAIAQDDSIYSLSLENAKQLALQNNLELRNASLDVLAARRKVFETTAIGLPHADAKGSYSHMITVPEIYKQFIAPGQDIPDEVMNHIIDSLNLRNSTSIDITVSQLIFSGAYIVGLQTSRVYKNLSTYAYESKEDDIFENVVSTYVSVLVAEENIDLLKKNLKNVESLSYEMKQLNASGMVDEISYNQVVINLSTIKNALSQVERQHDLANQLLKYQLGLDLADSIQLTDKLEDLIGDFENEGIVLQQYSLDADVKYKLAVTQENLMKQNYNLNKTSFLPNVAAFYVYHKNLNDQSVDFTPQDMVGVSVSMPLLSSGERIAKLSQARISYEQAKNNTEMLSTMLTIGVEEAKSSYLAALEQIKLNRENLTLATKIYDQTLEKNRNGMASSTEIAQTQVQLLTMQGTYYMSVYQLAGAKLKLDKAFNQL